MVALAAHTAMPAGLGWFGKSEAYRQSVTKPRNGAGLGQRAKRVTTISPNTCMKGTPTIKAANAGTSTIARFADRNVRLVIDTMVFCRPLGRAFHGARLGSAFE